MKALLRNVRERKTEQRNARMESLQQIGKKDRRDTSDDVFKGYSAEAIETMDPDQFKQLKVVNQLRRLNKAGEEMTWVNLLEYMGITEADYLEYGKIWRELGGEDPSASLRQKDQFIFLMDLKELCNRAKHIFSIDEFTDETVAKMEIPVMEFSYGEKVHRSDVTYALFNQTPLMQDMGKNQNYDAEKKRLDNQIVEHLLKRYPTRELMNEYVGI